MANKTIEADDVALMLSDDETIPSCWPLYPLSWRRCLQFLPLMRVLQGSAAAAHVVADPVDQEAEKTTPPAAATNTKAVAGLPSVVKAQSAPKASAPTTVIIRKAGAEVAAAPVHHAPAEDLDAAMLSAASLKPASSSVARPTKAKEMDFEFDWDDLEAEARRCCWVVMGEMQRQRDSDQDTESG